MGRSAAIGVVVALALAGTALGARSSRGGDSELPVYLTTGVVPKQLPRRERAPIEFRISGEVKGQDGRDRPTLRKLVVWLDRSGTLDVTGLPTCRRRRLQSLDTAAVEAACRDALVGHGTGVATLAYPENAPIPVESDLLVFNGGTRGGITTLFIRGTITVVKREAIVSAVKVEEVDAGRYGLRVTVKIPSISDNLGYLTDFSLRFKRLYGYAGERRSVFKARCADGKLVAAVAMKFDDGREPLSPVLRTCSVTN